ncbi:hypothetical protein ONZ45_g2081 [Pleurotus djamor]|nr:hypothetical protein ONZ45_g2081 [Pleurotus djamor]
MHVRNSLVYRLTSMMLYDGLGYFFVLTCVNVANLIAYRSLNLQTAACSAGYAITWIMCQRLLLHLHSASIERRMDSINAAVTISQNIESSRDASSALRSQFERKSGHSSELTIPDFSIHSLDGLPEIPAHVDVQVRIERTVKFENRPPREFPLENYTHSGRASGPDSV